MIIMVHKEIKEEEKEYLALEESIRDTTIKSLRSYLVCIEQMAEEDREFARKETTLTRQLIKELEDLTYCVVRPTTITEAKFEISKMTGAPENIIEVEIDHATPSYTQYSLRNRFDVYEKATNKARVADFYRFPSRKF